MVAKHLTSQGIPTPGGKMKWSQSTVLSILTNEKYKGDALLQKSFTVDFLTKKMKVNEGEVPQYYVENSHPAIITPEEFDIVQTEIAKRSKVHYSSTSIFSSRLICEDCGSFFGAKVWHSNDKYRKVIYQCNKKFEHNCETPHLDEKQIKAKFMEAFSEFFQEKETIINNCKTVLSKLKPSDEAELQMQLDEMEAEFEKIINGNSTMNFENLKDRYNAVKAELDKRRAENLDRKARLTKIRRMLKVLESDFPSEFDDTLWVSLIDTATVMRSGQIRFKFIDGTEILK